MMIDTEGLLWLLGILVVASLALYGTGVVVFDLLEWIGAI